MFPFRLIAINNISLTIFCSLYRYWYYILHYDQTEWFINKHHWKINQYHCQSNWRYIKREIKKIFAIFPLENTNVHKKLIAIYISSTIPVLYTSHKVATSSSFFNASTRIVSLYYHCAIFLCIVCISGKFHCSRNEVVKGKTRWAGVTGFLNQDFHVRWCRNKTRWLIRGSNKIYIK